MYNLKDKQSGRGWIKGICTLDGSEYPVDSNFDSKKNLWVCTISSDIGNVRALGESFDLAFANARFNYYESVSSKC